MKLTCHFPLVTDNGGLGSFYRGAKLSLDSINSSSEWNGVKSAVGNAAAAANYVPDETKDGRSGVHVTPHHRVGSGVVTNVAAAGSSQSLEEWGRMDDFGLTPETHPDGRKSNFYRSRSFTMLDHVGQVIWLITYESSLDSRGKNKAGYTATLVACGWAGAVLEKVTGSSGQELYAQKAQKRRKSKKGTDQPTNRPTNQPTNQRIDIAGCRVA